MGHTVGEVILDCSICWLRRFCVPLRFRTWTIPVPCGDQNSSTKQHNLILSSITATHLLGTLSTLHTELSVSLYSCWLDLYDCPTLDSLSRVFRVCHANLESTS
jgi:hypothetical protein